MHADDRLKFRVLTSKSPRSGARVARPPAPESSTSHGSRLFACTVLSLAAIFATTGFGKITGFAEFEASLIASRLVPLNLVSPLAASIVALEFILAAGLTASLWAWDLRHPFFLATGILVSGFLSYAIWRQTQGIQVPCHCFGSQFTLPPWAAGAMNVALLSFLGALMVHENRRINKPS